MTEQEVLEQCDEIAWYQDMFESIFSARRRPGAKKWKWECKSSGWPTVQKPKRSYQKTVKCQTAAEVLALRDKWLEEG